MSLDLFSTDGMRAWQQRLNRSERFAARARDWSGRLVLVERNAGQVDRRTLVVVQRGACTEARPATAADDSTAEYILAADAPVWAELVRAQTTPATEALRGRLHLLKGNLITLAPHAAAAAELLAVAAAEDQ